MGDVILTALGVGGATVIGALLGFLIKKPSHKLQDIILSFAAGVMLAAAVVGLIMPSLEDSENKLDKAVYRKCDRCPHRHLKMPRRAG